uniref:Uncharacterized protein n=1 Tax=Octopus bimaculoides TaxID=37653 RepID=A0A0L8H695_OCTBM
MMRQICRLTFKWGNQNGFPLMDSSQTFLIENGAKKKKKLIVLILSPLKCLSSL